MAYRGKNSYGGYPKAAEDIARQAAKELLGPLLDTACARLAFILRRLYDIAADRAATISEYGLPAPAPPFLPAACSCTPTRAAPALRSRPSARVPPAPRPPISLPHCHAMHQPQPPPVPLFPPSLARLHPLAASPPPASPAQSAARTTWPPTSRSTPRCAPPTSPSSPSWTTPRAPCCARTWTRPPASLPWACTTPCRTRGTRRRGARRAAATLTAATRAT